MAASAESEYTRTGLHVRPVRLFVGSWDLGESEERSFRVARTVEVAPLAEGEEVDEDEVEPEWYDERWHDVAGDWMRASCDIATDALCVISLHATIKPGKGDAARRAANLKLRMFELERFFPSTTHRLLAQRFASDSTMAIGVWAARTLVDTWSKSGTFRKLKKTLKLKAKRGAAGMTFEETFVLFKQLWEVHEVVIDVSDAAAAGSPAPLTLPSAVSLVITGLLWHSSVCFVCVPTAMPYVHQWDDDVKRDAALSRLAALDYRTLWCSTLEWFKTKDLVDTFSTLSRALHAATTATLTKRMAAVGSMWSAGRGVPHEFRAAPSPGEWAKRINCEEWLVNHGVASTRLRAGRTLRFWAEDGFCAKSNTRTGKAWVVLTEEGSNRLKRYAAVRYREGSSTSVKSEFELRDSWTRALFRGIRMKVATCSALLELSEVGSGISDQKTKQQQQQTRGGLFGKKKKKKQTEEEGAHVKRIKGDLRHFFDYTMLTGPFSYGFVETKHAQAANATSGEEHSVSDLGKPYHERTLDRQTVVDYVEKKMWRIISESEELDHRVASGTVLRGFQSIPFGGPGKDTTVQALTRAAQFAPSSRVLTSDVWYQSEKNNSWKLDPAMPTSSDYLNAIVSAMFVNAVNPSNPCDSRSFFPGRVVVFSRFVSGVFGEFEPITIITPMLIWPAVASDQPGYIVLKRIKEIAPLKVHAGSTCRIALSTVEILTTAQRMYTAKGTDRNLDQIAREQNMNRRTLRRANPDIGRRVPLGAAIRIPISLQVPENSIPTVRLSRLRVHIDDPAAIQLRLPNGEPLNLADKSVYTHEMRQILLVSIIDLPWKCIDGDATDSDSIASAGTMEVMNMTRVTSAGKTQVAACIDEELGDAPITQTKVLVHRDNFDGDEWVMEDFNDSAGPRRTMQLHPVPLCAFSVLESVERFKLVVEVRTLALKTNPTGAPTQECRRTVGTALIAMRSSFDQVCGAFKTDLSIDDRVIGHIRGECRLEWMYTAPKSATVQLLRQPFGSTDLKWIERPTKEQKASLAAEMTKLRTFGQQLRNDIMEERHFRHWRKRPMFMQQAPEQEADPQKSREIASLAALVKEMHARHDLITAPRFGAPRLSMLSPPLMQEHFSKLTKRYAVDGTHRDIGASLIYTTLPRSMLMQLQDLGGNQSQPLLSKVFRDVSGVKMSKVWSPFRALDELYNCVNGATMRGEYTSNAQRFEEFVGQVFKPPWEEAPLPGELRTLKRVGPLNLRSAFLPDEFASPKFLIAEEQDINRLRAGVETLAVLEQIILAEMCHTLVLAVFCDDSTGDDQFRLLGKVGKLIGKVLSMQHSQTSTKWSQDIMFALTLYWDQIFGYLPDTDGTGIFEKMKGNLVTNLRLRFEVTMQRSEAADVGAGSGADGGRKKRTGRRANLKSSGVNRNAAEMARRAVMQSGVLQLTTTQTRNFRCMLTYKQGSSGRRVKVERIPVEGDTALESGLISKFSIPIQRGEVYMLTFDVRGRGTNNRSGTTSLRCCTKKQRRKRDAVPWVDVFDAGTGRRRLTARSYRDQSVVKGAELVLDFDLLEEDAQGSEAAVEKVAAAKESAIEDAVAAAAAAAADGCVDHVGQGLAGIDIGAAFELHLVRTAMDTMAARDDEMHAIGIASRDSIMHQTMGGAPRRRGGKLTALQDLQGLEEVKANATKTVSARGGDGSDASSRSCTRGCVEPPECAVC